MSRSFYRKPRSNHSCDTKNRNGAVVTVVPPKRILPPIIYPRTLNNRQYLVPYPCEFNDSLKGKIKERDNYRCQSCGAVDTLQIHHIDYDQFNSKEDNLITLCNNCHVRTLKCRRDWYQVFYYKLHKA